MKKIGVLMILMLVVIVFCGKKNEIDKILPSGGKKAAQSKQLIQQNLNSYNKNIKIYNRILELDKELLYYFEDTGTEETFKKPVQEMTVNIPLNQALIDRIKEVSKSPKPTELDKKAGEMIPVLEEMLPVITEMNNYYGGKLYQKDNYKKAQELHSKMIKITEKYNVIANKYEETFQANARDVRENKMQDFVKNKEFTDYNQFIFIRNSEDFVKEISRQNLDASNFTEGNIKEFKVLQEKVNKSLDVFRKTLKNGKQLKKEGFEKEDFDPFITKASAFKRTMDEFVKKMEKKEKASHSASSDSYFAQSEEGTPENILKSYNELIAERNKILEKKASKKS
jgi:hypothetical protein